MAQRERESCRHLPLAPRPSPLRILSGEVAPMTAGPLAGVRVLELGSLIAGPFCGRILADFGAEVLKIEPPGTGDPLRTWSLVTEHGSLWALTQSRKIGRASCRERV